MFFRKNNKDYFYLLEKNLESGKYTICASCEQSPIRKEIKSFEKKIGYKLPQDFVDFSMSSLGGIYVEVKEEFWPRAKQYEVGPFWSFLYGLMVYGFACDVPEWLDIEKIYDEFKTENQSDFTPFMKIVGDADAYCFGRDSKIYRWSHETGEFELVEKTFMELLDNELGELEKRKDMKEESLRES